jgi:small GTP-binding protein
MDTKSEFDYLIKLLILGDSAVGKTNFLCKLTENKFNQNYMASTAIDIKNTSIKINGKNIKLQIWDTAGQEKYRALTRSFLIKAQGILALYDITNHTSFDNLQSWLTLIKEECYVDIPVIIVGNKMDLEEKRIVDKEEASEYAKKQNVEFIETSSKTGENVEKTLYMITEKVLQKIENSSDFSFTLDSGTIKKKRNKHSCC